MNYISQKLTSRVKELAERYATPLPKLNNDLEKISAKVNEHLKEIIITRMISSFDTKIPVLPKDGSLNH